jgi:SAM-dependent methyltransferase
MGSAKRDFDKESASWDEAPGRVKVANDIADAILEEIMLTSDVDVLDFGCGTGLVSLRLQPLVHSVTGVDSSKGMLDVFKEKIRSRNLTNVRTQYLDIGQGYALEGSYHLIVSSMTFHHIKEIRPVLDQFYKISAPSGYLCIADLDPDEGMFHDNNDGIFHFGFDRAALRGTFIEAGFEDIRVRTAAEILKPVPAGGTRLFTVFLMTGRKRAL